MSRADEDGTVRHNLSGGGGAANTSRSPVIAWPLPVEGAGIGQSYFSTTTNAQAVSTVCVRER